jgi:hypothetical protein
MVYRSPGTSFTRKDALDGNEPEEAASAFLSRLREWPVSMSELCGRYQISRPTGYKWVDRIETEDLKAVDDLLFFVGLGHVRGEQVPLGAWLDIYQNMALSGLGNS